MITTNSLTGELGITYLLDKPKLLLPITLFLALEEH